MNTLKPIKDILPIEEFSKLKEIQEELDDAWHKRQVFRTDTEARYSVLNDFKFPTKASKYWQSVREQCVHFDELMRLSFNMRRKEIEQRENADKLKNASGYELDKLHVDKDEIAFDLASMRQVAKDRVREVMQWSQIKSEVNDGSFDDKNVNTHQKESLFKSVLNRAQVAPKDISAEERLSIEGILHMLKDAPENKELVDQLKKKA